MITEISNPYIGPRPFTSQERNRFFGRDREARDLIPLVISERLVLFYAQSGAGKSSLINARLIPMLEERNFVVLPVGRVSGEVSAAEVDNIFTYNLLLSLEKNNNDASVVVARLARERLVDYLANLEIAAPVQAERTKPAPVDAPQVIGGVQPLALIIDQFEEIFTTHPEAWKQRTPFFQQIAEAMEADPYLWVVLAIREDYVGALEPYSHLLPGRLRARYYMQRMGQQPALEAVTNPVKDIKPFEPGVAEKLVDNLRLITSGENQEGKPIYIEGQFIEPVQLQVVCYQLWENLRSDTGHSITAEDLERLARGGDLAQFISRALADFYEQAIAKAVKDSALGITERKIRDWFSKELITEAETRGSVFMGERSTGSLPNDVVRRLESQFIVRSETRAAGKWYEISHDRFVGPILQANRAWYDHNPRPVLADAEVWANAGRAPYRLYEGRQLSVAIRQLELAPDSLSELEREFIQAGQVAADRQRTRRQRVVFALMALLVLVLLGLTTASLFGFSQAVANEQQANLERTRVFQQKETADAAVDVAETERAVADEQRLQAEYQRGTAEAYSQQLAVQREAEQQARSTAESASTQAVYQRDQAEVARNDAEVARGDAEGGRLASLSDYFRASSLDMSLLLAVEAVDLIDTWETRSALFDSLQRGLNNRLDPFGAPVYLSQRPYTVAFHPPDGDSYAIGYGDGSVEVFLLSGSRVKVPATFRAEGTVFSLSYSSDGTLLAMGARDGLVRIWDQRSGNVISLDPIITTRPSVLSLAFQPGGDLLAIATQREDISRLGRVWFYNTRTGKVGDKTWDCGAYDCTVLAWSQDGGRLAVANKGGGIKVLDVNDFKEIFSFDRAHRDQIYGLAWHPDGEVVFSGGIDQRLMAWDINKREALRESDRSITPVIISMAISPDGRYLVAGASDPKRVGWTSIWDTETLSLLDVPRADHNLGVSGVSFDPQGGRFVTTSYDSSARIWDYTPTNPLSKPLVALTGGRVEAAFNLIDGRTLIAQNSGNNQITIFDEDGKAVVSFSGTHSSLAYALIDGRPGIAFGGYDGKVFFVDVTSGRPLGEPIQLARGSLRSLAVGPGGNLLAAAACRGANKCDDIVLWDRAANQAVPLKANINELNLGMVTSLSFNHDETELAIANADGLIYFYNTGTGVLDQPFAQGAVVRGGKQVVTSMAFGPEGSDLFAAGYFDGKIALWQASTRAPIGEFAERTNGEITSLLFRNGADGYLRLVATAGGGEVREYEADPRLWQQRACQLAGRDFTVEEKRKFRTDPDLNRATCPR